MCFRTQKVDRICSKCCIDDIVVNAEEEEEAGDIVTSMDATCTKYMMEIGPDKTKIMTNNADGFQREIKIKASHFRDESSQMKDSNRRYFPALPKQQSLSLD